MVCKALGDGLRGDRPRAGRCAPSALNLAITSPDEHLQGLCSTDSKTFPPPLPRPGGRCRRCDCRRATAAAARSGHPNQLQGPAQTTKNYRTLCSFGNGVGIMGWPGKYPYPGILKDGQVLFPSVRELAARSCRTLPQSGKVLAETQGISSSQGLPHPTPPPPRARACRPNKGA